MTFRLFRIQLFLILILPSGIPLEIMAKDQITKCLTFDLSAYKNAVELDILRATPFTLEGVLSG